MTKEDPLDNLFLSSYKHPTITSDELKKQTEESELSKFHKPMKASAPIIGNDGFYESDLMFLPSYMGHANGGKTVIMNLIHIPTRYLYSFLLHNKSDATHELIELIPKLPIKMTQLRVDKGREFINNKLQSFLSSHDIELDVVNKSEEGDKEKLSSYSLGPVEVVNKTLRSLILRALAIKQQTGVHKYQFAPFFDRLVASYNNSPHSALANISPAEELKNMSDTLNGKKLTEEQLIQMEKVQHEEMIKMQVGLELKKKIKDRFPQGSLVRVKVPRTQFTKGAVAQFSDALYRVVGFDGYRVKLVDQHGKHLNKLYHELTSARLPKDGPFKKGQLSRVYSTGKPGFEGNLRTVEKESHKEDLLEAKKEAIKRSEKRESISTANIIEGPRERKPNKKYT